jgi:hypothetical protein
LSAGCFYRYFKDVLEHLWFIVAAFVLGWFLVTVTTWPSWTSFVATWTTVTSAVITARTTLAVVTAWTTVSAWLALRFNITLRLLDEGLA